MEAYLPIDFERAVAFPPSPTSARALLEPVPAAKALNIPLVIKIDIFLILRFNLNISIKLKLPLTSHMHYHPPVDCVHAQLRSRLCE